MDDIDYSVSETIYLEVTKKCITGIKEVYLQLQKILTVSKIYSRLFTHLWALYNIYSIHLGGFQINFKLTLPPFKPHTHTHTYYTFYAHSHMDCLSNKFL